MHFILAFYGARKNYTLINHEPVITNIPQINSNSNDAIASNMQAWVENERMKI